MLSGTIATKAKLIVRSEIVVAWLSEKVQMHKNLSTQSRFIATVQIERPAYINPDFFLETG
jgi:hypothetical protein